MYQPVEHVLTYELPFGKSLTGLPGKLIGGWQVNGISTLLTGFPFTPLLGSNRSGTATREIRTGLI